MYIVLFGLDLHVILIYGLSMFSISSLILNEFSLLHFIGFFVFFNIHYVASMIVWETAKHFAYLSFWENLICFIYVYQKFMYMFNKGQVFLPACKIEIVLHRAMYVKQYNRDSGNLLAATSTPAIFTISIYLPDFSFGKPSLK